MLFFTEWNYCTLANYCPIAWIAVLAIHTTQIVWCKSSRVDSSPHVVSSCEQWCTRRAAHGAGGVKLREDEALPSQLADVRSVACRVLKITIAKLILLNKDGAWSAWTVMKIFSCLFYITVTMTMLAFYIYNCIQLLQIIKSWSLWPCPKIEAVQLFFELYINRSIASIVTWGIILLLWFSS